MNNFSKSKAKVKLISFFPFFWSDVKSLIKKSFVKRILNFVAMLNMK